MGSALDTSIFHTGTLRKSPIESVTLANVIAGTAAKFISGCSEAYTFTSGTFHRSAVQFGVLYDAILHPGTIYFGMLNTV